MSELALDLYNALSEIGKLRNRIAELEGEVTKGHELQDAYCDRIAELEGLAQQLVWVGNDLLADNTNPVTITLFSGLAFRSKELLP